MKLNCINVKGKLWNNNQSILCYGRKRNVINYIPKQDADIDVSYVLGTIFVFFLQGLITEGR
jgi:hypothetical protein